MEPVRVDLWEEGEQPQSYRLIDSIPVKVVLGILVSC